LIVKSSSGWVQQWDGKIEEIKEGDVVWTAPGVKHWHGATPKTTMTHIALQKLLNGKKRRMDGKGQRRTILSSIKWGIKGR